MREPWREVGLAIRAQWAAASDAAHQRSPAVARPTLRLLPRLEPDLELDRKALRAWKHAHEEVTKHGDLLKARHDSLPQTPFECALYYYARGEPILLLKYLRSPDFALSAADREALAQYIEGRRLKPGRGRPKNRGAVEAAQFARAIYAEWKVENLARGIDDYGLRDQMLSLSIEYALELGTSPGEEPPTLAEVAVIVDRPTSRRN